MKSHLLYVKAKVDDRDVESIAYLSLIEKKIYHSSGKKIIAHREKRKFSTHREKKISLIEKKYLSLIEKKIITHREKNIYHSSRKKKFITHRALTGKWRRLRAPPCTNIRCASQDMFLPQALNVFCLQVPLGEPPISDFRKKSWEWVPIG